MNRNAPKFRKVGSGRVTVETHRTVCGSSDCELLVEDEDVGNLQLD
jgi:hypothetical protein